MFQIQNIPAYILVIAAKSAAEGVAMEDVQAKLVSEVKKSLQAAGVKTTKQGFASVSKGLEVSFSTKTTLLAADTVNAAPVRFYRFCEAARKLQADWGAEVTASLPTDLLAWLAETVSKMQAAKATEAKAAKTPDLVTAAAK